MRIGYVIIRILRLNQNFPDHIREENFLTFSVAVIREYRGEI